VNNKKKNSRILNSAYPRGPLLKKHFILLNLKDDSFKGTESENFLPASNTL
jgi:hypothetical protein